MATFKLSGRIKKDIYLLSHIPRKQMNTKNKISMHTSLRHCVSILLFGNLTTVSLLSLTHKSSEVAHLLMKIACKSHDNFLCFSKNKADLCKNSKRPGFMLMTA